MQGFRRMQKRAVNPQTVHRRLDLLSDLPTLPNSAYHQLTSLAYAAHDLVHGARQLQLCPRIGLVQLFEVRQGRSFRGHHMECCRNRGGLFRSGRWGVRWIGRSGRPPRRPVGVSEHMGHGGRGEKGQWLAIPLGLAAAPGWKPLKCQELPAKCGGISR